MTQFRLDGSTLVVTCIGCGTETRATSGAPLARAANSDTPVARPLPAIRPVASVVDAPPLQPPETHCPKCITRRLPGATACPSCGLSFSQVLPDAFAPPDDLRVAWLALLPHWNDEGHHESMRARAMEKSELADLGRLYRIRLAYVPDDALAKRGLDEVLRLAVLPSTVVPQRSTAAADTWKYVAAAFVILVSLLAIFYMLRLMLASQQ